VVTCPKKGQVMSEKQRKSFTAQFKAKVALEAIRGEKTLNEIGRDGHGLSLITYIASLQHNF